MPGGEGGGGGAGEWGDDVPPFKLLQLVRVIVCIRHCSPEIIAGDGLPIVTFKVQVSPLTKPGVPKQGLVPRMFMCTRARVCTGIKYKKVG